MIKRWKYRVIIVTGALMGAFLPVDAFADKRVALVIGNSKYEKVAKLPNPANDAADVAETLKTLGFQVIELEEADRNSFTLALRDFQRKAIDADAVVFFYAGHGIQVRGMNYFVPVEADVADQADVNYSLISIEQVSKALDVAPRGIRIMILDTCRDNPLARSLGYENTTRGIEGNTRGLVRIDQQTGGGTIVVYATQSNQVAQDGAERNSPFTSSLLKRLREPGLEVSTLFRRVTSDVSNKTNGKQVPEVSSSLVGNDFYLNQSETDTVMWPRVRDSINPQDFRDFVTRYPNSFLVPDAHHRIQSLELNGAAVLAKLAADKRASEDAARMAAAAQENALKLAHDKAAREEADRVARLEADKKASEEAARMAAAAQENTKRIAREETARLEAERAARAVAQLAAEKATREETLRVARAEAEARRVEDARLAAEKETARLARIETDRLQKLEVDRLAAAEKTAREDAARIARAEEIERIIVVERERLAKIAAAAAEKAAREDAARIAKAQETDRLAAAERERQTRLVAENAAREAEKRAAVADAERLARIETDRLAALARDKADALARETAARFAAAREETARLAQIDADRRKLAEAEAAATAEREKVRLLAEKATQDEAVRVAAANAETARVTDVLRLAAIDADKARQRGEQESAARAETLRQDAARIAQLEQDQKDAAEKLEIARLTEIARLDAEKTAQTASAPLVNGQQFADLESGTRTTGKQPGKIATGPGADSLLAAGGDSAVSQAAVTALSAILPLADRTPLALDTPPAQLASLGAGTLPAASAPAEPLFNTRDLIKSAQAELVRVGCYAGRQSGNLNTGTMTALDLYGRVRGRVGFAAGGEVKITARFIEEISLQAGGICVLPKRPTVEANLPDPKDEADTPAPAKSAHKPIVRRPVPQEQDTPAPSVHTRPSPGPVVRRPPVVVVAPRPPRPGPSNVAAAPKPEVKFGPMTGF